MYSRIISHDSPPMNQRRSRSLYAHFALPLSAALVFGVGAARTPVPEESPLTLTTSLSERTLTVMRDGAIVKQYDVAIGADQHPTPTGTFTIKKLVWNPAWVPPAKKWAAGKSAKGPGHPANPMKLVKIFFQEPDYYIHGTGAVETLGSAASHGCLRMDPDEAGEVALMVMENAGVVRDWEWVKSVLHVGQARTVALARPAPMTVVP